MKKQSVNRGGRQTPDGYLFEITGGALCLDLANTVDKRPTEDRRELLRDYADLVGWGVQTGAVSAAQGSKLRARAAKHPGEAKRVLRDARTAREAIFSVLSSIARGVSIDTHALRTFNRALAAAMGHLRVEKGDARGLALGWDDGEPDLDRMLWPALKSAADLLTSADRDRARVCAAPDCDWLFVDRSKNGTRRWCDMTVCGNRAKAKRFYRIHRGLA